MNGAEAEQMAAAARKSGKINTVWFNYRRFQPSLSHGS